MFGCFDAVALLSSKLMCRMAPLLGGNLSRRVFLDRFAVLCSDGLFHVRKICAGNFGEFSSVVGQDITESVLVIFFAAFYRRARARVFVCVCVCAPHAPATN